MLAIFTQFNLSILAIFRALGVVLIEENEKAWFPAEELREYYGIGAHESTTAEKMLFCIRPDGSEGMCYTAQNETQYQGVDIDFEDDEL